MKVFNRIIKLISISALLSMLLLNASLASESKLNRSAQQALGFSSGWISGSGITYRRYYGNHFLQGTIVGVVSNSANDAYLNTAISTGTYLHKLGASGIIPPLGLKIMAGADLVIERQSNTDRSPAVKNDNYDKTYYGAGVGIDFGNPGRAGLSLWLTVNYVFAFDGITSPTFDWFGPRPSAGILYGW